jgi:hypothetical protein
MQAAANPEFPEEFRSKIPKDSSCARLRFEARIAAMLKTRILAVVIGLFLVIGVIALAQPPERNVSGRRHPNLAAAQRFSQQAYDKIVAAQQANEWDMQGHAQHAKELLDQVNRELKEAAEAANHH